MTITLTKKYRLIWEQLSLNIQNDFEQDYSGSLTMITDNNEDRLYFESDNYQDILDEIEEKGLHIISD